MLIGHLGGGGGGGHKLRQEKTIGSFQILCICHLYQYRIHRNHPDSYLFRIQAIN